jgi:purine-binding chemotaxis protein CheW
MTDTARVLLERARAMAQPLPGASEESAQQASIEVLEFRLADERYAVETGFVHAVHPLRNLTELPCTPPFVLGIVNLRGHIVTVVNLKKFFGLPEQGLTDLHRIVLVGDGEIEFGLLADVSVGVRRITLSALQPALATLSGIGEQYVQGITADSLVVLDMARILGDPRMLVNEEPAGGG